MYVVIVDGLADSIRGFYATRTSVNSDHPSIRASQAPGRMAKGKVRTMSVSDQTS